MTAAISGTLLLMSSASVFAQEAPSTSISIADPGRVSEEFRDRPEIRQVSPEIEVTETRVQGAPAGAENIRFRLDGLNIEGVSAYTANDLSPVYNDKVGQDITLADLYQIAANLTTKYRNDGYILTQVVVPPQTIEDGVARLRVVEGTIDAVVVNGPDDRSTDLIRRYADKIHTGGPLNIKQLERQLLLINDLPGVSARSVLSPSPSQVGASDLQINVTRDPFDALVSVDNYGSRYLGPVQLSAAGALNNALKMNEKITVQTVVAPESWYELAYVSLAYEQPIFSHGTTVEVFASQTRTRPGYDLEQFDVKGQSDYASVTVEHPFIRSRAQNLDGRVLFDWRDVETENNLNDDREDHIRALRIGGRYDFMDSLIGIGINSVDLQLSQGLDLFGASDGGDDALTRAEGDGEFFKINADVQRLQRVTNSVNLLLAGRGQWTDDELLSSEEFGVGGTYIGRAFDSSEIVGDSGFSGKAELQWNKPIQWNMVEDYHVFTFFDAGRTFNDDATETKLKRETATSTGLGIRTEWAYGINADFTLAIPLNREVQTQGDEGPRAYFSISKRF